MSEKELPLTDAPNKEGAADSTHSDGAAASTDPQEETQAQLKEAYERARDDLRATADRLKNEIENIDAEEISKSATAWIKENPGLSFALVVGAGIIAGKAISSLTQPDPPPSLRDRVLSKTGEFSSSARSAASVAADRFSQEAKVQGEHLANRLHEAKGSMNSNAHVLGQLLAEQAGHLGDSASDKTNQVISSFTNAAERAADSLQVAAKDLAKSAKKYKKSTPKGFFPFMQASKTLVSAFIIKQLSDWVRKRG